MLSQKELQISGIKNCLAVPDASGSLGLSLTRSPCDVYPWVRAIQPGSSAERAGILVGDYLIRVNHDDILGQSIVKIADKIKSIWHKHKSVHNDCTIPLTLWNPTRGDLNQIAGRHPMQRYVDCLKNISELLECPICYEGIVSPVYQCCNGHIVCNNCRSRSQRCALCRVPIGPRGRCMLAEEIIDCLNKIMVNPVIQSPSLPVKSETDHVNQKIPTTSTIDKSDSISLSSDRSAPCTISYRCPIDRDCVPLTAKFDVFAHLQNHHRLQPTHYYCCFGEKITIDFDVNNLIVVLISKNSGFETFFIMRMIQPLAGIAFWNLDGDEPVFDLKMKLNGRQWKGKSSGLTTAINLSQSKNYIKMSVDQAKNNKYEIQIK